MFHLSNPAVARSRADAVRNRQLALDATMALLARPGASLTVEAIAKEAGLGTATVFRAFGGKDALLDAAVSRLLEPVVERARDLLTQATPYAALRAFLPELLAFQVAHHAVSDQLADLELPAVSALRAGLVAAVEAMVDGAQRDGEIRTDLDPGALRALIGHVPLAVARAQPWSQDLADAYLTVLFDGLRPAR
jgi:AcrR family transcriptional regulator